ncbi:MAG: phospholipase [Planctomycetes bacterium]|nr:phospholipase [Planctomycetota bacterium]
MPVTDTAVRRLHEILMQVADIRGQIERGPKQIKMAQVQLQAARDAVTQCKEAIKQKRMEGDRKQLLQREREAKLYEWQGKLNGAKNNREYQAVKDQIAADTQANSVLSDEILEILESIDALQAKAAELEAKLKVVESDTAKTESRIQERLVVLKQELTRVEGELKAEEAKIPADFEDTYRRLVGSRAEEAFAPLDDKSCGGCNTGLTLKLIDQLRMGTPALCSSCGCLIYRPG